MDEDQVNRRDAVAGLGVLGALAIMLVATIFYRIINPAPPAKTSLEGLTIAAEPVETATPIASQPPAFPETAPVQLDGAASAAAFESEPSLADAEPQPGPTFVSPSGR
jgi:hypothetical protein